MTSRAAQLVTEACLEAGVDMNDGSMGLIQEDYSTSTENQHALWEDDSDNEEQDTTDPIDRRTADMIYRLVHHCNIQFHAYL